jgi:hypothetical protein
MPAIGLATRSPLEVIAGREDEESTLVIEILALREHRNTRLACDVLYLVRLRR